MDGHAARGDAAITVAESEGLIAGLSDQEDAAATYEQIDRRPQDILQIVLAYNEA